jgi:hypothetical protein
VPGREAATPTGADGLWTRSRSSTSRSRGPRASAASSRCASGAPAFIVVTDKGDDYLTDASGTVTVPISGMRVCSAE